MKLMSIAGARPNFMKLASIANAVEKYNSQSKNSINSTSPSNPNNPNNPSNPITHIIVHTGQHYDKRMSQSFFDDLGIPKPDINLEVGSGSHACQTADIMKAFESVLLSETPDFLLVVGDVNSTVACSLVAAKIEYPKEHNLRRPFIVHVEAGLRSFDRDMPEEINRILTDSLSDILFITEKSAEDNLIKEGIAPDKIFFPGNVMIDTLKSHIQQAEKSSIKESLGGGSSYGLVTLHRPSNVDVLETLEPLIDSLVSISQLKNLIFPVHPRTKNNLNRFNLLSKLEDAKSILLTEPLAYLDFLNLIQSASFVITDSGGIQEETTYLNVPCITLRDNTERPVTVEIGSNYLIGVENKKIFETVNQILSGKKKNASIPERWDGMAGDRIIQSLVSCWNDMRPDPLI